MMQNDDVDEERKKKERKTRGSFDVRKLVRKKQEEGKAAVTMIRNYVRILF